MRFFAFAGLMLLAACGAPAPNPYPEAARADFPCTADAELCACTWDKIIRAMTNEEYQAAVSRFRETGRMDPRVTRARTQCLDMRDG